MAMAATMVVVVALPASADAPDPDLNSTPSVSMQVANDGTISVTVTGQWKWTTHTSNCNNDKRGVGVAIDWNDPGDPGNYVTTLNGSVIAVGTATDKVVHPATSVGLPNSGSKVDIASPSQYASWRGGCGTYGYDPVLKKSYNSGTYGPLTHDYKPIGGKMQSSIKLCALMYDVHLSSNGGAPNGAKEVTAGGNNDNSDNSAEKNGSSPGGNACKEIAIPQPKIATSADTNVTIGDDIQDAANLSDGTVDIGGTITFKLYAPNDPFCTGTPVHTATSTVNGNGTYYAYPSYTTDSTGQYHWIASYSGDTKNLPVSGSCGDSGETSVVTKSSTITDTWQKITPNDTAVVTGYSPTGNVTFQLYSPSDPTCTGTPVFNQTVALVDGSAATTNSTAINVVPGTYRWKVTYAGDSNNNSSTSACGVEAFTVTQPF